MFGSSLPRQEPKSVRASFACVCGCVCVCVCVCVDFYYHNVIFLLKHRYENYFNPILVETSLCVTYVDLCVFNNTILYNKPSWWFFFLLFSFLIIMAF